MPVSLAGGSNIQRSQAFSSQYALNVYRILDSVSKTSAIYPMAGFKRVGTFDVGANDFRGRPKAGIAADIYGFYVVGNILFRQDSAGALTNVGTLDTSTGTVSMSLSNNYLTLVDGAFEYTYDLTTGVLTKNVLTDTPINPTYTCEQQSLTFINSAGTQEIYQSAPGQPMIFSPLNFILINYNSSYKSFPLVAFESVNGKIMALTTGFSQILVNKSQAGFTFGPDLNLVFSGLGTVSAASVAIAIPGLNKENETEQVIIWLCKKADGDHKFMMSSGGKPQPISTESIEFRLNQLENLTDAIGMIFSYNGQTFYVVSFPTDNMTWAYNLGTEEWYDIDYFGRRHPAQVVVAYNNKRYFTSAFDNGLYEMSEKYVTQSLLSDGLWVDAAPKLRIITDNIRAQGANKQGGYKKIQGHVIRIYLEPGLAEAGISNLNSPAYSQATDPMVEAFCSGDSGKTWNPLVPESAGRVGEFEYVTTFYSPGCQRDWTFRFDYQAPVPWYVMGVQFAYNILEGTQ